jgi:hypothetical protein
MTRTVHAQAGLSLTLCVSFDGTSGCERDGAAIEFGRVRSVNAEPDSIAWFVAPPPQTVAVSGSVPLSHSPNALGKRVSMTQAVQLAFNAVCDRLSNKGVASDRWLQEPSLTLSPAHPLTQACAGSVCLSRRG